MEDSLKVYIMHALTMRQYTRKITEQKHVIITSLNVLCMLCVCTKSTASLRPCSLESLCLRNTKDIAVGFL